jgi:hypothetical protein
MVSLFSIDRFVIPKTKSLKGDIAVQTSFSRSDRVAREKAGKDGTKTLTIEQANMYMYLAMEEIDKIVFQNLKAFDSQFQMPVINIEEEEASEKLGKLTEKV